MQRYCTRGTPFPIQNAPRMPKHISKKTYLVPAPKARLRQGTSEKPRFALHTAVAIRPTLNFSGDVEVTHWPRRRSLAGWGHSACFYVVVSVNSVFVWAGSDGVFFVGNQHSAILCKVSLEVVPEQLFWGISEFEFDFQRVCFSHTKQCKELGFKG